MQENFLDSARKQFEYYRLLGQKTFDQLSEEELFWQFNSESNSIAIMVNHLWGNMMSRWTNFLNSDGEKEWRNRDMEFEDVIKTKAGLLRKWEEGWTCVFQAFDTINETNFGKIVYIRNQGHTIIETINRQMGHYAYHVGQIVYVGRMIKGKDWQSLSIPKGKSKEFNQKKFAQEKHRAHFSDEFLKDKND